MHVTSALLLAPAEQACVHEHVVFTKSSMHVKQSSDLIAVRVSDAFGVMSYAWEQFLSIFRHSLAICVHTLR